VLDLVPEEVQNFPKPPKGNIDTKYLPDIVKNIYQETCNAYRDGALTLAGIGFRATIEAICNDQKIPGDQLNVKISNLANKGLLSKKDSSRLHSIRFMGNDAVHDTKKPLKKSLRAALIIVEHLITTVYIIDKESSGKLDLIIEDYSKFERLLNEKIAEFSEGDEYPLEKFLGKDIRLIFESKKKINDRLNEKIGKGEYKKLAFGKKGKYLNSKVDLQHYIVT
jgi:hypothetical protein